MRRLGRIEREELQRSAQARFVQNARRLTAQGVLGFYNCCEVTEIFAVNPGGQVINVFSIFVLEERKLTTDYSAGFLTDKLITVKGSGFNGFGVRRYFLTLEQFYNNLDAFVESGVWQPSGDVLLLESMALTRPCFVPPDATDEVPLNGILKNNFWNGCHVLEFFAQSAEYLSVFLDKPALLQEFSEKLQAVTPIKMATLSDRLGNILFQFPVDVLAAKFGFNGDTATSFEMAWDQRISGRSLTAISENKFDNTYPGFSLQSVRMDQSIAKINTGDSTRITNTFLWDAENQIILAASGGVSAIRQVFLNTYPVSPEPRQIVIPLDEVTTLRERVRVSGSYLGGGSLIGDPTDEFAYRERVQARKYSQEQADLLKKKDFVQYGQHLGRGHQDAIADLRSLIETYGRHGAWLWDPYLSAIDIMQTLFFCTHGGVDLRALGASDQKTRKLSGYSYDQLDVWKSEQQVVLNTDGNNYHDLYLEFRVRHGNVGWSFHDRFLIFPMKDQEPRAYSLGTSVNSLGKDHHILQRVSNGRLVADAFQELWSLLDADEFLIWKYPQ